MSLYYDSPREDSGSPPFDILDGCVLEKRGERNVQLRSTLQTQGEC